MVVPVSDEGEGAFSGENQRFSDALAAVLYDLGVRAAYGIVGGAIAPLAEALDRSPIEVKCFRHESGAAFAAVEASFASGRPVVVFTTTGPGLTNALTGMTAARWDGAKVIVLTGTTPPVNQGRFALQETSPQATPFAGFFSAGPLVHYGVSLSDPLELRSVRAALGAGVRRPGGFVANIGVPIHLQSVEVPLGARPPRSFDTGDGGSVNVDRVAALLAEHHGDRHPFCLWLGFGARNAARGVRALAERTGVGVMCTPRGKGIFPEDHPQFVGVTGFAGQGTAQAYMARHRPVRSLVIGTRLGELSSLWDPNLVPEHGFIHVDVDPAVVGVAYPDAPAVAVGADAAAFVDAVLARLPAAKKRPAPPSTPPSPATPKMTPRPTGPVRPQMLMESLQRVVVDGSDAVVIADGGNSFAWAIHLLRFKTPRFRASMGFASMGHACAGVVGIAHAVSAPAVAIVGDGAMLMLNEISTAVQYKLPAIWVVLNDGLYGMVEQGMRRHGLSPVETHIPTTDFVAIARGMGADGVRVDREADLDDALVAAFAAGGPFVIDVVIDAAEDAPIKGRVSALVKQERAVWR